MTADWMDEVGNQPAEVIEAERHVVAEAKTQDRVLWESRIEAEEAALAERRAQQLLDDPDGDESEDDDSDDPVLPLDRFPHIVFTAPQSNVTAGMSHFSRVQQSVTENVSQKSVTRRVSHFRSHKCLMCSTRIPLRAKTCSPQCRKAASRRKQNIADDLQDIQEALERLRRYSDDWPDLWPEIMSAVNASSVATGVASRYVAPKGDNR